MPDGVASIRRLSLAASIIRFVMLVWLDRSPPHRLVARDRLFQRGTLVLQPGIDSSLGPNVTLLRERYGPAVSGRRDSVVIAADPQHHCDLFWGCGPVQRVASCLPCSTSSRASPRSSAPSSASLASAANSGLTSSPRTLVAIRDCPPRNADPDPQVGSNIIVCSDTIIRKKCRSIAAGFSLMCRPLTVGALRTLSTD